jgi:glycosyltransferase involved in cell wall biosynthesis
MSTVTRVDFNTSFREKQQQLNVMVTEEKPLSSTRRLKVLMVPAWYPTEQHKTLGTFCREHAHAAALYDDVAVLAYSSRPQRWPSMRWSEMDDQGIRTFYATCGHSPIPKTTYLFFLLHLRRAIRRVIQTWGKPDIIHTQDTHAYHVLRAVEHLKIPVVMSQHWHAFMTRSITPKLQRHYSYAFSHAARVFPANKYADEDYRQYGLTPRLRWLPNTLSTDIFWPRPGALRNPWLLHASGFTKQKRFPDIVRAFARVRRDRPEAVLQVVGDGSNRVECEELARRELSSGSYHFHGFLPKPKLADLMRLSCGFVFPSEAETFGCVLMEAMACGCPVLTTQVGGIPAVVRNGEGLFAVVGNIEQIANGMRQLLDGTHGLDVERISCETRTRFSHETIGRILHEEYRKVLSESLGPHPV